MIRDYISKNKKKASVLGIILGLFVIVAAGVGLYKFTTLAGVFQKTDDGKYVQKNEVNILEIVAQNGQQVMGYTVEGSEPISKEQIEAYHGDIDVEDFKNATGYVLKKTASSAGFNYQVEDNVLNDTFNKNVLGESMSGDDIIRVNVVQANELTAEDINNADLVYINSADYNANLLYYYDQIVNRGEGNIEKGSYGATYNGSEAKTVSKSKFALKQIKKAIGKPGKASLLTAQTYKWAGISNVTDYSIPDYNAAIGASTTAKLVGETDEETISLIEDLIEQVDATCEGNAFNAIKAYAAKGTISDDERALLTKYLKQGHFENYKEVNNDVYIDTIISSSVSNRRRIDNILVSCNTKAFNEAIAILKDAKNNAETADINAVAEQFKYILSKEYIENNKMAYANEFMNDPEGIIDTSLNDTKFGEAVSGLFEIVNSSEKKVALNIIASVPEGEDEKTTFVANAKIYFENAELENYDEELLEKYVDAITALTDKHALKIQMQVKKEETTEEETTKEDTTEEETTEEETTEEETTKESKEPELVYEWVADKEAIENLLAKVNKENTTVDEQITYDISWNMAKVIYNYAMVDERALMYNVELLKNKAIGDYTTNDVAKLTAENVDNTNNMYKMLLVMRQMTSEYFTTNVLTKIDEDGFYFVNGLDANGEGIISETDKGNNAWYKGTFYPGGNDRKKFREPDVVGKTYGIKTADGRTMVEGPSTNYVYKNIYSYSGSQFMGGELFVNGSMKSGAVSSNGTDYTQDTLMDSGKKYIYVNFTNTSWGSCYIHYWETGSTGIGDVKMTHSDMLGCYWAAIPANSKGMLFRKDSDNYNVKTADITIDNNNYYAINSNKTYSVSTVDKPIGMMATPGANSTDNVINFINSIDVQLNCENISSPKYKINGGSGKAFNNNDVIKLGQDAAIGDTIKLEITGDSISKTYYYKKVDPSEISMNYMSNNTASNSEKLGKDQTQTKKYEQLINNNATKGDIIRYIMNIELNVVNLPYRVLVIEPIGGVKELNDYESAKFLAQSLKIDYSAMTDKNYSSYFKITCMSVREFNTRTYDLNSEFDLIYFGTKSGNMAKYTYKSSDGKTVDRTFFCDSKMNGLVYTGIGDIAQTQQNLTGTAASDYIKVTGTPNAGLKAENDVWKTYFFSQFEGNDKASWNLDRNSVYYLKSDEPLSRYAGNDITVLKMNELLDYLKAGYPIMFDEGLLNSDEYTDAKDLGTTRSNMAYKSLSYDEVVKYRYLDKYSKLYNFIKQAKQLGYDATIGTYTGLDSNGKSVFADGKTYPSIIEKKNAITGGNPDYLDASNKFEGGLSYASKRSIHVDFNYISGPQEYYKDASGKEITAGAIGTYLTNTKSYSIKLGLNTNVDINWVNENYNVQMYVDKSGTGRFEDDNTVALDPQYAIDEANNQILIQDSWPGGLEGFIPWKVEVSNKNNEGNKWTYTGYSAFVQTEKKDVQVLWVKTEYPGSSYNLDFESAMNKYKGDIKDYDITVTSVKYSDFVKKWARETGTEPYTKETSLLKVGNFRDNRKNSDSSHDSEEFSMIVFGYSDSYYGLDMNNIRCLNNIDYFVNTAKHSLLFAHDNASYITTYNYYTSNGTGPSSVSGHTNFARYTTSYIRYMLGMDVYGASYSPLAFKEGNNSTTQQYRQDVYKTKESVINARKYLNPNLQQQDYRGFIEGLLLRYSTSGDKWPYRKNNGLGDNIYGLRTMPTTTTAKRVNAGQITMYPFNIGENLDTATTHYQYTRLDLEDKDVTVWYTLSNGKKDTYYNITEGDGSNNYYIYSKGNITYTGSGHSSVTKEIEIKLFINTVVAAIKVGDFDPSVSITNASKNSKNENIIYAYDTDDSIEVKFKPLDYDSKKGVNCFKDCKIYIDNVNETDSNGSLLPEYNESVDALLNNPSASVLTDQDGNSIALSGPELSNREESKFRLSYSAIAQQLKETRPEYSSLNMDDKSAVFAAVIKYLGDHPVRICVENNNGVKAYTYFKVAERKLNYLN